jgi:hypothetical protein
MALELESRHEASFNRLTIFVLADLVCPESLTTLCDCCVPAPLHCHTYFTTHQQTPTRYVCHCSIFLFFDWSRGLILKNLLVRVADRVIDRECALTSTRSLSSPPFNSLGEILPQTQHSQSTGSRGIRGNLRQIIDADLSRSRSRQLALGYRIIRRRRFN